MTSEFNTLKKGTRRLTIDTMDQVQATSGDTNECNATTLLDLMRHFELDSANEDVLTLNTYASRKWGNFFRLVASFIDEHRAKIKKYEDSAVVVDPDLAMRLVLWFFSPIVAWDTNTYAIFIIALITTSFNASFNLDWVDTDEGIAFVPESQDKAALDQLFASFLHHIHKRHTQLATFYAQIWHSDGDSLNDEKIQTFSMDNITPKQMHDRLIKVWTAVQKKSSAMSRDREAASNLFEAVFTNNGALLQKGLNSTPVVTCMMMHYARNAVAGSRDLKIAELRAEGK